MLTLGRTPFRSKQLTTRGELLITGRNVDNEPCGVFRRSYNRVMRVLKRAIKFIVFGLILFVLSVAYRFFGERRTQDEKSSFLGPKEANADAPSYSYGQGSYYTEGGYYGYSQGEYGCGCGGGGGTSGTDCGASAGLGCAGSGTGGSGGSGGGK